MVKALAEALKRHTMKEAQPARAGKLNDMVRAVLVNSSGASHRCLVGITAQTGSSARCIANDTKTLLARVCTLHHGFRRERQLSSRLRDLLRTWSKFHNVLTTDAAADELNAAELVCARINWNPHRWSKQFRTTPSMMLWG